MIKKTATLIFVLHFVLLSGYILSKHSPLPLPEPAAAYVSLLFPQEWEMFAPPPQSNTLLFYRFAICSGDRRDTTGFHEVLRPLYRHQTTGVTSLGRLSYFLFNTTQNVHENQAYYLKNLPDSIPECDEKRVGRYLQQAMARSYTHQALVRHGRLVYAANFPGQPADSVLFSYHIIHEKIPAFEQRFAASDSLLFEDAYWNSPFYKIIDRP